MKKVLLMTMILSLLIIMFLPSTFALAQEDECDAIGYDLGDYLAEFEYKFITHKFGELEITFEVTLDRDFLESSAYSDALAANSTNINENYHPPLDEIESLFINLGYDTNVLDGKMKATLIYPSYTEYYIDMGIDGFEKPTMPAIPPELSEQGLLYNYYTSKQKTIFNDITHEDVNDENLIGKVLSFLDDYGVDLEFINFKYTYGTIYANYKRDTNADVKYKDETGTIFLHEFNMDITSNTGYIEMTTRYVNAEVWYGGAIAAGIAIALIPLLIALIKRKKVL